MAILITLIQEYFIWSMEVIQGMEQVLTEDRCLSIFISFLNLASLNWGFGVLSVCVSLLARFAGFAPPFSHTSGCRAQTPPQAFRVFPCWQEYASARPLLRILWR